MGNNKRPNVVANQRRVKFCVGGGVVKILVTTGGGRGELAEKIRDKYLAAVSMLKFAPQVVDAFQQLSSCVLSMSGANFSTTKTNMVPVTSHQGMFIKLFRNDPSMKKA